MTSTLKQLLIGLLVLSVTIAAVVKTWLGHAWGDHYAIFTSDGVVYVPKHYMLRLKMYQENP